MLRPRRRGTRPWRALPYRPHTPPPRGPALPLRRPRPTPDSASERAKGDPPSMRARSVLFCFALLASAPGSALAQGRPAPEGSAVEARNKAEEGLRRYDAGRWQEAYDLFLEADRIHHAPTLVLYMANCQRGLGNLLAARALDQRLSDEEFGPDAPAAFLEARANARKALKELAERIPFVRVTLTGPGAEHARVLVDGVAITPAEM